MGELIELAAVRRRAELMERLQTLYEGAAQEAPPPSSLGWTVADVEDGFPVRWFNDRYQASIGYVAGDPDQVYLDYGPHKRSWRDMTIEELAVGLETGMLPLTD
ncbi:MAG: hypothetical protein KTR31_40665 [Myxococcales bacterium]|nr:hypothetical protein [Myxococcales bacterium]